MLTQKYFQIQSPSSDTFQEKKKDLHIIFPKDG